MKKILIIQTAYIGDVVLATSLVELAKTHFPNAKIDFLLRKGNESLLEHCPHIDQVYIWDKARKIPSLIENIKEIRKHKYDLVLNIQRFFNSGLFTLLTKAVVKIGFHKNPLSFFYTYKVKHQIPHMLEDGKFLHEVDRNAELFYTHSPLSYPNPEIIKPKLYFSEDDQTKIKAYNKEPYLVFAPTSVWYTKQWHQDKWKQLIALVPQHVTIYLIGGADDSEELEKLKSDNTVNLAGKLSLRESALLMQKAARVIVNDSAPLHLASSVNAKTTAIFCSTIPEFGYGPLSDEHEIIQLNPKLDCMPCGLHGKKECPKSHFKCAMDIDVQDVFKTIRL